MQELGYVEVFVECGATDARGVARVELEEEASNGGAMLAERCGGLPPRVIDEATPGACTAVFTWLAP